MRDDENSRRSLILNPSSTFSSFYSVSKIKMHCSNLLDYKKYKYSFFQVIIKNVDKYSSQWAKLKNSYVYEYTHM